MTHKEVYHQFESHFPQYAKDVKEWFPSGKNTVRVRLNDRREFIFNYEGLNNMRFETLSSYVDKMKGEKK